MNIAEETRAIVALEAIAAEAKRIADGKRRELAAQARQELEQRGVAPSWAVPDVAKVTLALSKAAAEVADQDKLTAWLADRYPHAVVSVQQIRPAFLAMFLTTLAHEGDMAVDRDTGEIVPGVRVRKGGQPGNLSIRADPMVKRDIGERVAAMLADAHPALTAADEVPSVDDPWIPTGDPFALFPAGE